MEYRVGRYQKRNRGVVGVDPLHGVVHYKQNTELNANLTLIRISDLIMFLKDRYFPLNTRSKQGFYLLSDHLNLMSVWRGPATSSRCPSSHQLETRASASLSPEDRTRLGRTRAGDSAPRTGGIPGWICPGVRSGSHRSRSSLLVLSSIGD